MSEKNTTADDKRDSSDDDEEREANAAEPQATQENGVHPFSRTTLEPPRDADANEHVLESENNVALPDAIDLVLHDLHVESEAPDGKAVAKKLTFDGDVAPEVDGDVTDESCSNPIYRYKVLDTLFLFWNTLAMGWVYGQVGPALPDIQLLAGVPLQQATWLFTGFAIGYLGGCLLSGLIQDRFSPRLMLFVFTMGTAVTSALLPWLPTLVPMVIVRVLTGVSIGGQDTGIHSMLFAIWEKEGGPFIQMTHCLSALGGILAPLVTQPFLSKYTGPDIIETVNGSNAMTLGTTNSSLQPLNLTSPTLPPAGNQSNTTLTPGHVETNIQYAFLITGVLLCSAAIPFLVAFLTKRRVKKIVREYSNDSFDKHKLPKRIKQTIVVIIFTNSFIATAYIDLFPSFLVTFLIQQSQWSQQSASTLTSVYFGTYGLGNFIGVFILAYITSTKLIAFSYSTSGITILGILLSVMFMQNELIWVTVALSGFTMSAILPTLFTWTQENVTPITGRMASGLLISGSLGVMLNPLLLGYMMEMYSAMWFIYLSLGETILCAMLFITAFTLSRVYSSAKDSTRGEAIGSETESPVPSLPGSPAKLTPVSDDNRSFIDKVEIYPRGTLFGI